MGFSICKSSTSIVLKSTPCSFYASGCETRAFKSNSSTCWETIWMIGLSHSLSKLSMDLMISLTRCGSHDGKVSSSAVVRMLVDICIVNSVNSLSTKGSLAFRFIIYNFFNYFLISEIHWNTFTPSIRSYSNKFKKNKETLFPSLQYTVITRMWATVTVTRTMIKKRTRPQPRIRDISPEKDDEPHSENEANLPFVTFQLFFGITKLSFPAF